MRRVAVGAAIVVGLCVAYTLAHLALIEVAREVIVLRTRAPEGGWLETRLWIVDDGEIAWLHGGDSGWMRNLEKDPVVEIERCGETHRYNAVPVPGPHPMVHQLMREKYGLADWWVRLVVGDEGSVPVRLDPL
jgi:hypothetical protein